MSLFKMKRGQESKVNSLAKEDGSLIFSLNGANNSTVRLDQTVNGTVQRLGISVDKAKDADGVIDYNEPTRRIKIGYAGAGLSTSNLNYIAGYTNNGTQIKDVSKDVLKNWLGTMGSADSAKVIEPFENATANASRNVWFSDSEKRNKPVYNDNFKYNPVSQILTTNISGSAAKWATARTVTLNGDLSGSFSIDGSGNVSANIYDYHSTVYVGNTNNYPYHRIAKLDTISSSYVDKSTLLYLSQGYQGGCFGIIRVTLRTNNVSGGAKSGVEARWLIRSGFNIDDIKIGHYSVAGKTYADVFYRSNSAYAGCVIRDLGSGSRGNIGRCWTLVNSRETENNTTSDKKTSFECWATIELAGKDLHNQAYSEIISSSDGGTVAYANNSGALGGSSLSQVLASAGGGKFLPLAGGTMTGTITAAIGNQKGIKIGNQWITSASDTNGEVVLQGGHLRFGTTAWDYNQWAGLKYNHSNKGIYLGIADGSQFIANSPQSGGSIYTPGIDNIYVGASTSQKVLTTSNYTSTTDGRYVKKAGDTMSGNLLFSNSGAAFRGIQGQVGDNDYWRVMGGATGSNAGFLEIATGDDATEPIYVRQYSGVFTTLQRTLTLMDASGHTRLYGNLLLNRSGGASLGRIGYYSPSYYTWFSYMSNPAGGAAPTGGMPSTYSNVTSWAQRSLIENASGYGWIWESASNSSAATNVMPTPMMSLSSNNGNLAVRGTVISPYFNGLAKNSNALGGSSLSQVLSAAGSDKFLPLAGGTLTGPLSLQSTLKGITTQVLSGNTIKTGNNAVTITLPTSNNDTSNAMYMYANQNGGDIGIIYISPDTAFIANSGDTGYVFRVIDKDVNTNTNSNDGMLLGVRQSKGGLDVRSSIFPTNNLTYSLGSSDLNWNNAYASTFHGYLNGTAKNSNALGGTAAINFAVSSGGSNNTVENSLFLLSNTTHIDNRFQIKISKLSSQEGIKFPSNLILSSTFVNTHPQLKPDAPVNGVNNRTYSILHIGNSSYRHDLMLSNSSDNNGIIYAMASSAANANQGYRLTRILDSLNYSDCIYTLNKQVSFSSGLIANSPSSTVLIDGGSY